MSWENDKEFIIFMLIMILLTLFCIIMAVFSSKKNQRKLKMGQISKQEIGEKKTKIRSSIRVRLSSCNWISVAIIWNSYLRSI